MEELEIDAYGECEKMTYYNREDQFLRQRLQKEIPILRALIQNLYEELDRKLHLNGAKVPITFGYDTDTLGSYTRNGRRERTEVRGNTAVLLSDRRRRRIIRRAKRL